VLKLRHETRYQYQGLAALGYNLAWITPAETNNQHVLNHRVTIEPVPRFIDKRQDSFGNTYHYFEVQKPHERLRIISEATVQRQRLTDDIFSTRAWEEACLRAPGNFATQTQLCDFCLASPLISLVDEITEYAQQSFTPGRPILEALDEYNVRIHSDFRYEPGTTSVETPLTDAWEQRSGVCQDFAHIAIAGLRGLGLPAAYVSGYILTYPAPGAPARSGADASHAWFAVWVPDTGWVQFDPTNRIRVNDEHIMVAIGRDYSDVPPVKGVCYGGGAQELHVSVEIKPVVVEQAAVEQTVVEKAAVEQAAEPVATEPLQSTEPRNEEITNGHQLEGVPRQ
jgi:transglutaminase-like putative cysteine protease